jgi:hypothetical protein
VIGAGPSCPDCGRVGAYNGRYCLNCGRELDGRPPSVTDRAERHIRKLERLGLPTKDHGPACISRPTGGWAAPTDEHQNHTLRQTCPCCARSEFRGSYCSGCGTPTGASDWHAPAQSEAQREAWRATRQNLAGHGKDGPGRDEEPEPVTLSTRPSCAA